MKFLIIFQHRCWGKSRAVYANAVWRYLTSPYALHCAEWYMRKLDAQTLINLEKVITK